MYDKALLLEKLVQIDSAIEKINRRFAHIKTADDFLDSNQGMDMLDGIAMMLIAISEHFKKIDRDTSGAIFSPYPHINWSGVKGLRDILSHQYFNIDAEEIFAICKNNLGDLHEVVKAMMRALH
ncbi:MAG: DUF86 domain-containing protein [Chlorobiaceae bacterium]|nr:DUF86 domain-containing protein [Chlorobiaceae bacterium]